MAEMREVFPLPTLPQIPISLPWTKHTERRRTSNYQPLLLRTSSQASVQGQGHPLGRLIAIHIMYTTGTLRKPTLSSQSLGGFLFLFFFIFVFSRQYTLRLFYCNLSPEFIFSKNYMYYIPLKYNFYPLFYYFVCCFVFSRQGLSM